jgi:hypothetical protein
MSETGSIEDGTKIYRLEKPFKIGTAKGSFENCTHVLMKEPTPQHAREVLSLRQKVSGAEFHMQAQALSCFGNSNLVDKTDVNEAMGVEKEKPFHEMDTNEYEKVITGSDDVEGAPDMDLKFSKLVKNRITALEMSKDEDGMYKFTEMFKKLALKATDKRVVFCNSTVIMKEGHWVKVSINDRLNMAMAYTCFFVMPSEGGDQKQSEKPSDYQLLQKEA